MSATQPAACLDLSEVAGSMCGVEVEGLEVVGVEAADSVGVLEGAADAECGGVAGDLPAPNIEVRVLPYTAGAHPAVSCNFTVLAFPGAEDAAEPEVIYTKNIVAFVLQDDSDEVARFQRIYDRVWGMTVDAEASVAMMRQAQARDVMIPRRG